MLAWPIPPSCHGRVSSIITWLQAFSIFTAVLVSSDSTIKEEAAGLAAHSYLIIQLSKDLSGLQWLKYDQSYREWAAAKGIHKCGEMNFSIYGRCLASQHSSFYTPTNTRKERPMPTSATDGMRGIHVLAPLAGMHIVVVPVVEITEKLTVL